MRELSRESGLEERGGLMMRLGLELAFLRGSCECGVASVGRGSSILVLGVVTVRWRASFSIGMLCGRTSDKLSADEYSFRSTSIAPKQIQ